MKDNDYTCLRMAYAYEAKLHYDWTWGDPPCWPREIKTLVAEGLAKATGSEPDRYRLTTKGLELGRNLFANPTWRPFFATITIAS